MAVSVHCSPPQPIPRNTKQKGLPHQEQSLFSGKFELFHNPKGRQRALAANLIDLQRLPEPRQEALPVLGTNLGQKSVFLCAFRPVRPKQFVDWFCFGLKCEKDSEIRRRQAPSLWGVPMSGKSFPRTRRRIGT